jgi:NAD(P)-dependent dehydrogenase (short-subunit alcohol dehydrogenase family)
VIINGRGEERVSRALAEMRAAIPGARIEGVAADLATPAGAAALIEQIHDADILVNNLGSASPKPFADITDDDWLGIFQLNVMSGVRMSRRYLPGMVSRGWGRVVFISSESGVNIPKEMIDYGMTKAAQLAISRGLAESVAETGVTVNAVLPGPTRSEIVSRMLEAMAAGRGLSQPELEKEFLRNFRPTSLLGRFTSTEEVANMVVYVCSEQASGTSGAALRVDGGVVRFIA